MQQETISVAVFRAAHKALGHVVIGMVGVPAAVNEDGTPGNHPEDAGVPAWARCLDCALGVEE